MGACSQSCEKDYNLTPRGELVVKGKGVMYTYWLDPVPEDVPTSPSKQIPEINAPDDTSDGLDGVEIQQL